MVMQVKNGKIDTEKSKKRIRRKGIGAILDKKKEVKAAEPAPKKEPVPVPQVIDFYSAINRRVPLPAIPLKPNEAQDKCTANNVVTLLSWHSKWKANIKANVEKYKYFDKDHSVKVFLNDCLDGPVICCAAGPSLKKNIKYLKEAQKNGFPIICGAHTFMYLAKEGIKPTYVTLLDAGDEWIDYIKNSPWDDIPLFASIDMTPSYLEEWKGPIYFLRSTFPDDELGETMYVEFSQMINHMPSTVPTGGHTGGLSLSIAHMVLMASEMILVGYDYAYDNTGHFYYGGDSKIDLDSSPHLLGSPMVDATSITGEIVRTSTSYLGFKLWSDMALRAATQRPPQNYIGAAGKVNEIGGAEIINASEGGILGAYAEGNLSWIKNMRLEDALVYSMHKNILKNQKRLEKFEEARKERKGVST